MKKYWVKKIDFFKKYLSLIILFPATIGGLWQLIELALISPSYIRFFSISQIVPDGLLVLLFLSCIVIGFFITRYLFQFTTLSKLKSTKWSLTVLWMIPITILFAAPLIFMYFGVVERGYVEIADIFTLTGCLTIILASFANLIPEKTIKESEDEYSQIMYKVKTKKNEKEKPKLKNYIFAIGLLTILIISLKLFGLTTQVIGKIRNDSVKTERLLNFETLIIKLKTKESYKFSEVLYINDKYIFVEYKDSNNNIFFEVLKNENLFE